ncbi:hypothetical protein MRX96_012363 [Rhipicephalus microplus]
MAAGVAARDTATYLGNEPRHAAPRNAASLTSQPRPRLRRPGLGTLCNTPPCLSRGAFVMERARRGAYLGTRPVGGPAGGPRAICQQLLTPPHGAETKPPSEPCGIGIRPARTPTQCRVSARRSAQEKGTILSTSGMTQSAAYSANNDTRRRDHPVP